MKRIMNVIKVLKKGSNLMNDSRIHIYTHKTLGFSACHDKIKS